MINIEFKPLKETDLSLLYVWFQVTHVKKWYARGQDFTFEMIQNKYGPRINHPTLRNFICYFDDSPIGYVQLYPINSFLPEGVADYHHSLFKEYSPAKLAGIDLFIANQNILGKGYGSLMLTHFINKYVKGKFEAVVVDPKTDNTIAIDFFRKNGFVPFPENDSSHYLMVLKV